MKRVRSNNERYTASNEDQTFIEHDLPFRFAFLTADVRPDRIARFRLFDERQVSGGSLRDVRA